MRSVLTLLTGDENFAHPEIHVRAIMSIGAVLMAGWTVLLVWAVQDPIKRRFIAFLTTFVVVGMLGTALLGLQENKSLAWIVGKTFILAALFARSFLQAERQVDKTINLARPLNAARVCDYYNAFNSFYYIIG